jgi:ADP-ribosylglycohydrolase
MIAAEGGDADTNGAAAGALLGAYLGYKGQFPLNWTTQLADAPVMEQAIQHVEELSLKHASHLKMSE